MFTAINRSKFKTSLKFSLLGSFCTLCVLYVIQIKEIKTQYELPQNDQTKERRDIEQNFSKAKPNFTTPVRILYWTEFFSQDPLTFGGRNLTSKTCLKNCSIYRDRNLLLESDAVIFHAFDMSKHPYDVPVDRTENQIWVFLQHESPQHMSNPNLTSLGAMFNWTMTYRRDSDVLHNYFNVLKKPTDSGEFDSKTLLSKKTKLVAWFVSHCRTFSKREDYVEKLSKNISVDIYGSCGNLTCPDNKCWPDVGQQYKFYISFENALCLDYITEKFSQPLIHGVVPIVMGGGDYKMMAPPGSYIDVEDFESPQDLAEYLTYLDQHTDKYLEYFKWRKNYTITGNDGWCDLCRKLQRFKQNPFHKVYDKLDDWWTYQNVSIDSVQNSSNFRNVPACRSPENWE